LNNTELEIFSATYLAWLLSEFVGAGILPRLRQKGRDISQSNRGSRGACFAGVFIAIWIGFGFAYSGVALLPGYFFYIGIPLMILGIIIRHWAIVVLGRFFSLSVRIAQDHRVVDSGPYRLVRHPSYTGALTTFIGLALALESWGALIVILAMFALVFGYRIRVEETALESQLGDDYRSYMKRTKRLIPYLF
jgi:protein-S-isoprenylcysteine O-methyltransferase Ste14